MGDQDQGPATPRTEIIRRPRSPNWSEDYSRRTWFRRAFFFDDGTIVIAISSAFTKQICHSSGLAYHIRLSPSTKLSEHSMQILLISLFSTIARNNSRWITIQIGRGLRMRFRL